MAQQQMVKEEKSLGELFSELATETSTLVRQEVALAQTELSQKATRVGKNVGFLAVGGFVAYAAMLAVLAGIIMLLGLVIPVWLSAIIVGLVVGCRLFSDLFGTDGASENRSATERYC